MSEGLPIACSLDGDAARRRWAEWKDLMSQRTGADWSSRSLAVRFQPDEDLAATLTPLVAAERECCGFVEWDLEDRGSELVLNIRGDPEGVSAMAESFGLR
ncbi:MAG: hypothetical protein LC739_13150 [Actinobacteria bacterium]|nr:hypothetical protein [Actinomycetota bacterium]